MTNRTGFAFQMVLAALCAAFLPLLVAMPEGALWLRVTAIVICAAAVVFHIALGIAWLRKPPTAREKQG